MKWRWAVVKVEDYPVANMAPSLPGEPMPEGFKETWHEQVTCLRKCVSQAKAERLAPAVWDAIRQTGWIGGYRVEVWSRAKLEAALDKQRPRVAVRT